MRTRIEVTFTPGTRSISTGIEDLTIDDIRLIVNETRNEVICSSLAKSNVTSIVGGVVTFAAQDADGETLHALAAGDHITFEIDRGNVITVLTEISSQDIEDMCDDIINGDSISNNNE
jgi:hypothetical protein